MRTVLELKNLPHTELLALAAAGTDESALAPLAICERQRDKLQARLDVKCADVIARDEQISRLRRELADATTTVSALRLRVSALERLADSVHDDLAEVGAADGDGDGLPAFRCDDLVERITAALSGRPAEEREDPRDNPARVTPRELRELAAYVS